MEKRKVTIYIADQLAAALGNIEGLSLSKRLNILGDRYSEILRHTQIEKRFCEAEWNLLRDALNGTIHEPAEMVRGIWVGVEDALLDGLAEKWQVDGADLIKRLKALSYVEECAVVEAIERWWYTYADDQG